MENKYQVEIKTNEGIYIYDNVELKDLEKILTNHKEYEEVNAKQKEKEK